METASIEQVLDRLACTSDGAQFALRSTELAAELYENHLVHAFLAREAALDDERQGLGCVVARDSLRVAETKRGSLILSIQRPTVRPASVVEADRHTTLLNLGPHEMIVERFSILGEGRNDLFPSDRRLAPPLRLCLRPGESIVALAGEDILEIVPPRSSETISLAAWILSPQTQRFLWEYDRQSGEPVSFCNASQDETRLQYALKFLAMLEGDEQTPQIVGALVSHENHAVRWDAVRALLGIDPAHGKRALRNAMNDAHPHVAAAARKTWNANQEVLEQLEEAAWQ